MATPLAMAHKSAAWEEFLAWRKSLTARMQLSICDGCDGCGQRCLEGFSVTRSEWEAAQVYLENLPEEEVARVRRQPKTVPWPGAEEVGLEVTLCRYRDQERGGCLIYPARPTICRLFGHVEWLPCPIGAVDVFAPDAWTLWQKYQEMERKTWAEWEEDAQEAANQSGRAGALP